METGTGHRSKRWLIDGSLGFVLGAALMGLAFFYTPLGKLCGEVVQVTIQPAERKAPAPDRQFAQRKPSRQNTRKPTGNQAGQPKMPDPMEELRKVEAMNARNRQMMGLGPSGPGLPPQPGTPGIPQVPTPAGPHVPGAPVQPELQ